jgi:hypothetical protein
MDWIKKNYDQFTLALVAAATLGAGWLLYSSVTGFPDLFAAAKAVPVEDNHIVAVDTSKIDEAHQRFDKPTQWKRREIGKDKFLHSGLLFTSEPYYVKNGILTPPSGGILYNHSRTGEPMPNSWFMTNQLPVLDPAVPFEDPDADGFLNEDEWLYKTDPNNKESHPDYQSLLFFAQLEKVPFRFKFQAYDGKPTDDPKTITFQINPLDAGGRTKFVKIGEIIEGTNFKVEKFEFKEVKNPRTDEMEEVSELTVTNTETKESVALILNKVTDSPTRFAILAYFWGKKHGENAQGIRVRKQQEFALPPRIDKKDHYKLLDVTDAGAVIQLPDGKQYQVPPLKR